MKMRYAVIRKSFYEIDTYIVLGEFPFLYLAEMFKIAAKERFDKLAIINLYDDWEEYLNHIRENDINTFNSLFN